MFGGGGIQIAYFYVLDQSLTAKGAYRMRNPFVARALRAVLPLSFLAFGVSDAHATLIGDVVNCDIQPSAIWSCNSPTATVIDPGTEFILSLLGGPFFSVDFGPSSLELELISVGGLSMGAGEVLTLGSLDFPGAISSFTLVFSDSAGFVASDITAGPHSLTLLLNGSSWSPGDRALIELNATGAVPEPGTFVPAAVGLLALGLRRFHK